MSLIIFVTDEAVEDALTIAEYLAEQSSLNTSDKFLSATTQAYRTLAQMPGTGALRTYNNPRLQGMRMLRVPRFPNCLISTNLQTQRSPFCAFCTAPRTWTAFSQTRAKKAKVRYEED